MASKFRYQEGRTLEDVEQRARQSGGDWDSILVDGVKTFKPKEGENTLRILPPTWDIKDKRWGNNWGIALKVHEYIGTDKGSYICLAKHMNERCPICDALDDLDEEDRKKARARTKIVCYVIDRDAEKEGPQIWILGKKLENEIQTRCGKGGIVAIDHPDTGYDISFTRQGTKLNTQYIGVDIAREESYISENESKQDKWLDFIAANPIPDLLVFQTPEYIEGVFMGGSRNEPEDTADKTERPRRGAASTRKRGEEAVEEPADEMPNDEEMAANSRRSRRAAPAEEEAPRRGSQTRRQPRETEPEPEEADEAPPLRRGPRAPDEDPPLRRGRKVDPEPEPEAEVERPRRGAASTRRARDPEPEEVAEEEVVDEEESSTTRAKAALNRMRPGRR